MIVLSSVAALAFGGTVAAQPTAPSQLVPNGPAPANSMARDPNEQAITGLINQTAGDINFSLAAGSCGMALLASSSPSEYDAKVRSIIEKVSFYNNGQSSMDHVKIESNNGECRAIYTGHRANEVWKNITNDAAGNLIERDSPATKQMPAFHGILKREVGPSTGIVTSTLIFTAPRLP